VTSFKTTLGTGQINNIQIFTNSILNNLKTIIVVWILAVSIFGFPIIFLVAGLRGLH
jgi:uncharacterized membrane protein SpoIIM required for sporulation